MQRSLLKRQLTEAWRVVVQTDYEAQRVNSERSLQAALWAQLNERLPAKTRRMFIEPGLGVTVDGHAQVLYPDLVICNSRQVIAVVELKYQPRTGPSYQKDFRSLATLAECGGAALSNKRYRGPAAEARQYDFANKVLFVWAGIYYQPKRQQSTATLSPMPTQLEGRLLTLHGVTSANAAAKVYADMR